MPGKYNNGRDYPRCPVYFSSYMSMYLKKATLLPLLKLHIANSLQCPLRNPPEYSLLPVCLNLYVTFNITVTEQFRDIFHPDKLLQILLFKILQNGRQKMDKASSKLLLPTLGLPIKRLIRLQSSNLTFFADLKFLICIF